MKTIAKVLLALVCASAVAAPAMAQEKKSSISAFGNYSKFGKDKDASGTVNVTYGYLLSPKLEVGVGVTEIFGASSMTGVGGSAQYYLNPVGAPKQVNPYGKVDAFVLDGSNFTATQVGFYAGVAYAATESTEFFVEAGAQNKSSKFSTITTTDDGTIIQFGLKLRF